MNKNLLPVVIVNYRNPDNTLECLHSLRDAKEASRLAPIVVDSGSEREWTTKLQKTFGDWVTYLPQEKNLGFSGANNIGIRWALENLQSTTIILLNDDTTVSSNALTTLSETLQERGTAGAVVPKILFTPGREFHQGYTKQELGSVLWYAGGVIDWKEVVGFHRGVDEVDRGQYDAVEPTEFATGCCVALRVKALEEIGLFDDRYFLYLEDLDLSQRLLQAGWELLYQPQARIWHKNAGSSGSGSALHEYYFTRNRYLFGFQYAPWRTKLFLLKHLVIQWRQGRKVTRQAIRDFLRGVYGQGSVIHR